MATSDLSTSESIALHEVRARIAERFGLVPSFFMMARAEPPIVEAMFGLVEFAYFDSPLPALFKERLFTYVSRFCRVPYCMARHCAFLLGCGNVAGDPDVGGISVDEAVALLRTPFPDAERRATLFRALRAVDDELDLWPDPRSDLGETIFFASAVAFVLPREHKPLLAELERVLGASRFNYLMLFLGFIRFAHFWTESHQELRLEDDIEQLLDKQRPLAEWVAAYPDDVDVEIAHARAELRELEDLRQRAQDSEFAVADLQMEIAVQARATRAAEADSEAKATFMATVSHELRTPLNAVLGYVGLLEAGLGGVLEDQAKSYIARIKYTARHQQQIIEEILSYARLEAGRETVNDEVVLLPTLCDEVSAVISPLAESRGLVFTLNCADAPHTLITDPRKLRQILLNLLGNAVKFTPAGSITLTSESVGESVVFTVEDTGPGIRAADRERIFEAFTQLDVTAIQAQGGTGLGLAITKRLVCLLEGTIRVSAREPNGSAFVVTLPYHRGPKATGSSA